MAEKRLYMACLDLEGRRCLLVGGGRVALEKARGLLDCRARVTVVAPEIAPELAALPVRLRRRRYETADLEGAFLVVAATSSREVNRRVFEDAEARSLFCNVVDTPELCSLVLPAVHRRDPIAVAVSTGGASPALAQRLRDELGALVREEHAELARRLRELRPWAKRHLSSYEERRELFAALVEEALTRGSPDVPRVPPLPSCPPASLPRPRAGRRPDAAVVAAAGTAFGRRAGGEPG